MSLKGLKNEPHAPAGPAEDDAKPAASGDIGTNLDAALMQALGGNDGMSTDISSTRRTATSIHSSENTVGDQPLLTGEEARRAVVGRFTDELAAIGDTVEMRERPSDDGLKEFTI
jgi:hypothetical protein